MAPIPPQNTTADATSDLLALLAYGNLAAFGRTAADADLAPDLALKSAMARLAAHHYRRHEHLVERLTSAGLDAQTAMAPFVPPIDAFHARTLPDDWPEALLKAYVGEGIVADFAAVSQAFTTRSVPVAPVDTSFLGEAIEAELAADPAIAGRLALWGRRVVGEALSQAQRVAADRPDLADLAASVREEPTDGAALTRVSALLHDLTARYESGWRHSA